MFMKQCSKCKQEKQVAEFNKDKTRKDGLQYICKQCNKNHNKQYSHNNSEYYKYRCKNNSEYYCNLRKSHQLSCHVVYLLPDHNYVGITDNPIYRMNNHRSKHNRNTSNWVELKRFDTREEALAYESQLHSQGYAGGK